MRYLMIILSLLALVGCAAAPNPVYYRVDYDIVPASPDKPPLPLTISVQRLSAPEPLAQANILYRSTARTVEYHPYRMWESSPVRLASHYLVQTFKASGRFERVTVSRLSTDADLFLNGWLTRFEEVDYPDAWYAEVEIEFELTTARQKQTVAAGKVRKSVKAKAKNTDAVAGAMAQALKLCIEEVVERVAEAAAGWKR